MRISLSIVSAVAFALGAFASDAGAVCFSIFDRDDTVIYRSFLSPIDLSFPISDEMAREFPGDRLLITDDINCDVFSPSVGSGFAFYGSPALATAPSSIPVTELPVPGGAINRKD